MGSFGERLRQQREMRGISLDEIVATTKIGRRLLTALEEEQFDLLPGGIFNKAYVRAYAKCVGIDEDAAVAEYLEAAQEPAADTRVIAQQHASIHSDRIPDRSTFPVIPVLILLVVAAGAAGGWKLYQDQLRDRRQRAAAASAHSAGQSTNQQQTMPATAQSPVPAALPRSAASDQSTVSAAKPPTITAATPVDGAFELTVRPKDSAWVSIKSDGKYLVRGIIRPPDVKTIRATSQVIFFTGNAGHVEIAFNGKNVPLTGGANQEETLVFDARGVMQQPPTQ